MLDHPIVGQLEQREVSIQQKTLEGDFEIQPSDGQAYCTDGMIVLSC